MNSSTSTTLHDSSPLVALLSEWSAGKVSNKQVNLAEQLGRLIDVSESISLSRSLAQLDQSVSRSPSKWPDGDSQFDQARDDVLQSRQKMISTIVQSFEQQAEGIGIQLPSIATGTRVQALKTYEPYSRFYHMHQAEMAGAVQILRTRLRAMLSAGSNDMHQLAELDKILTESLAVRSAKLFNAIPKLLERRFNALLNEHIQLEKRGRNLEPDQWLSDGAWLQRFYTDLQAVLLAELDLRLQPIIGLLEALNDDNSDTF